MPTLRFTDAAWVRVTRQLRHLARTCPDMVLGLDLERALEVRATPRSSIRFDGVAVGVVGYLPQARRRTRRYQMDGITVSIDGPTLRRLARGTVELVRQWDAASGVIQPRLLLR